MRVAGVEQTSATGGSIDETLNQRLAANFSFAAASTAMLTPVIVIGTGVLYGWDRRLAVWAVLMIAVAGFHTALRRVSPTHSKWRLAVAAVQASSGFAWASSLVLVIPRDDSAAIAVAAATLLGVLASSVPFGAIVRSAALSFVGSITLFSTLFLAMTAPGPMRVLAAVFAVSGLFYAGLVSIVHRNHRETVELSNELARRAATDPLTGVLNRRAFDTALQREISAGSPTTVVFLDLDGFKPVNDEYGHSVGDELLCRVADRLAAVSASALVGRVGGDEFLLFESNRSDTASFGQEVLAQFEAGFDIDGVVHHVGCSVGIASAPSRIRHDGRVVDGGPIAAELVKLADAAQYRAKRAGGRRMEIDTTYE